MRRIRFESHHSRFPGGSPSGSPWYGGILARWLVLAASVMLAAYLIDGIHVSGFFSAIFAAAAIGVLNLFFRPVLLILTLPINILTLGLFTFIINALMLKMASGLIPGFSVTGFWTTVFGAIVISAINWLLNTIVKDTRRPTPQGPAGPPDEDSIDMRKKGGRWE